MVHLFDDLYDFIHVMHLSNCNVTNSNDQILNHVTATTFSRAGYRF